MLSSPIQCVPALDLTVIALATLWHQYCPNWRSYHGEKYPGKMTRGSFMHLFWVVAAFLLFEFYKSNLKASLMIKKYEPSIFNIEEALDKYLLTRSYF